MAQEMIIRTLLASEIDARVKTWDKTNFSWAMILLYKDARVDQRLMDETFGAMNWKRSHELIDGKLFCTVSVWNEKSQQWVSKQDVGTESDTEKEKGQASDAFKRACFNWGIGRELYSAPSIFLTTTAADYKAGKFVTSLVCTEISYNDQKEIIGLVLAEEKTGKIRFTFGQVKTQVTDKPKNTTKVAKATPKPATTAKEVELTDKLPEGYSPQLYSILEGKLKAVTDKASLKKIYEAHKALFSYKPWHDTLVQVKKNLV